MDGIGFRPLSNLENQSKAYSHHPSASLHQKRENCSELETTGTPEKGQTFAPHEVGRRCNAAGEYPPNGIVNLVQTS